MAPSWGTNRQANAAPSYILISSIPERLTYLLVVSIVAFLTYGAGAAPADHASRAPAPQATATRARGSVVEHASWYSPRMNGHKTATGERFSSRKMTAAAKGVPLGSMWSSPTSRPAVRSRCGSTIAVISNLAASSTCPGAPRVKSG